LNAILYTDIGMDPRTYFLAFARLAPVQCVMGGHPVTTGIPTIDYFLSSEWHELPEADAHYSERLVRMKNVPHYFVRPQLRVEKVRADFPLPPEARWYVCQQALFKIHPEFDAILGEILRQDPAGIVVLFEGVQPRWKYLLIDRFHHSIPDVADRVIFLPRLAYQDFLAFLPLADALLDTIHFTGGTTSMQALGLGLPLITLPDQFHRGRGTYSAYRRLGIEDCVARDGADYVCRAIRLANDAEYRESLRSRIAEQAGTLFDNPAAAVEIEEFLIHAVRESSSR
jgi:protein O-GlcNAc transferase